MKPAPFAYERAASIDEAVDLLARHGGDARLLAGGQSLVPLLNVRLAKPSVLIDINRVDALAGWRRDGDHIVIGSLTRQHVLERDRALGGLVPLLAQAVRHIGHVATRARGTIGGSLAHADPSAELPVCALALDAEMHVRSHSGRRRIAANSFFQDVFITALGDGDLLEAVSFVAPVARTGTAFSEIARRSGDFAIVCVAASLSIGADGRIASSRLALGGVGSRPVRVASAEAMLNGERPNEVLWMAAASRAVLELEPGTDLHATAAYRRDIAQVLIRRVLAEAAQHAEKEAL